MMSPLLDTRKVHALVLQHERQAEIATPRDTHPIHHALQISHEISKQQGPTHSNSTHGKRFSKKNLKCSYCDRQGHGVEDCFYTEGFPVGHKFHGKSVWQRKPMTHNNIMIVIINMFILYM